MQSPQDHRVTAHGLTFHCVTWGAPALPPLVCLHGATQTAHSWDEVAEALSTDWHVVCLDQRGHGDSDWPVDGDYARQTQAADVHAIGQALRLAPFVLMGMSMGGINAMTFTVRHPDSVRALVIVDVSPEVQRQGVEHIRSFVQAADELDSFEAFVERAHAFNPRRSLENLRSRLSHNLKQLPSGKWTWKYDKRLRAFTSAFGPTEMHGLWEEVRSIRCPTLIVRGAESDILSSDSAAKLREAIPGSTLAVVPGAGHSVMGDNPAGFVGAVRPFLQAL